MKGLNPAADSLPRSGIRVILDEANKHKNVIHLEIGQPNFPTPDHIIEAANRAAYEGYVGYTPNAGYFSLREAFASRLYEDYRVKISPEQVIVSAGAMGALFNAFCALITPGDEVLVPDPGYPNYYMPIQVLGAKAIPYRLDATRGFALDINTILPLISANTKLIIINSPSNPTGSVIGETELKKLIELTVENGFYILSDESYDHIIFEGKHVSPLMYDNNGQAICVYSCSKTYSMTGWRVGFMVTSHRLSPLMAKIQEMYVSCAPSISQKAAEAALNGPQTCVQEMVEAYRHRRQIASILCDELNLKCVIPQGAFYLMISLPEGYNNDSMNFALKLVKEGGVALAPGTTFGVGGRGYLRASLCASEDAICEGLRRLGSFYGRYQSH